MGTGSPFIIVPSCASRGNNGVGNGRIVATTISVGVGIGVFVDGIDVLVGGIGVAVGKIGVTVAVGMSGVDVLNKLPELLVFDDEVF